MIVKGDFEHYLTQAPSVDDYFVIQYSKIMFSKKLRRIQFILWAGIALSILAGCHRGGTVASIRENQLFTLNYGSFEDELNLFNLSGQGAINTYMTMLDGFFYIANGESKKIMELNSYGDLLSLYYNEEVTRAPYFATTENVNSTKKAIAYPFNSLGPVAVDAKKCLYAVDTLPAERQEVDANKRLLLNYIVLRFNSDGTLIDYLGQQGPGGTPFPFIKKIYVSKNSELIVVSETNNGPIVYWFNQKGFLLYTIPITEETVPKLRDSDGAEIASYVSIGNVVPDNISCRLYIQVDYFKAYLDPATKVQSGIDYEKTILYPLDVDSGRYDDGLEIPSHEDIVSENLSKELYKVPFDFLGVTDSGWFFFSVPVDKGFLIQMVQPNGQKILKRVLDVNHEEILYYSLGLSGNGIISGLFVKSHNAEVAWWRTDSLVSGIIN